MNDINAEMIWKITKMKKTAVLLLSRIWTICLMRRNNIGILKAETQALGLGMWVCAHTEEAS